jgi:predicted metal-dependent hydrolase
MAGPEKFRERLASGRAAFNRGEFFEAHEHWEEAWHTLAGPARVRVQGLIQIAAGLHHVRHGRPRPGARLLEKGLEKLSRAALPLADLPVDSLARDIARFLAELQAPGGTPPDPLRVKV